MAAAERVWERGASFRGPGQAVRTREACGATSRGARTRLACPEDEGFRLFTALYGSKIVVSRCRNSLGSWPTTPLGTSSPPSSYFVAGAWRIFRNRLHQSTVPGIAMAMQDGKSPSAQDEAWASLVQDEDPDVIIPFALARPLVASSNMMLGTAIVAMTVHEFVLAAAAVFVWATSILHWSAPRFSSWRRKLDYIAVASLIVVGSVLAIAPSRSFAWARFYFIGLAAVSIIFGTNEALYYIQLQRYPTGGHYSSGGAICGVGCLASAPPGTAARQWAYRRTVWVHLLCVHVLSSTLACTLLWYGICRRGDEC